MEISKSIAHATGPKSPQEVRAFEAEATNGVARVTRAATRALRATHAKVLLRFYVSDASYTRR